MSEKFEATKPRGCVRGEELVAYLYGEATKEEAALFGRHLEACAVCRDELAAFGGVRAELGEWRAEALGTVPSFNIGEALAPSNAPRKRSARAALREFFSLSPLWLRAGACAATLAVCALLALTLARAEVRWGADGLAFRAGAAGKVVERRVEVPVQNGYTEEQVHALVAKEVAQTRAQLIAESKQQPDERQPERVVKVTAAGKNPQPESNPNPARRTRAPRRTAHGDDNLLADDNLPRLSDLLSGSY